MALRTLSEPEFNAIRDQVLANAPSGLSEADFQRYAGPAMAEAVTHAESQPEGSALGRFVSNAASVLNPVAAAEGLYNAVRHPEQTYDNAVAASAEQFQKAANAPTLSEKVGHAVAGAIPFIGPAAAQAGEQIASGDIAGGLGRGLALAAGPAVTEGAIRVAEPVLKRGALRLMQGALKPTDALMNARKGAGFGSKEAIAQAVLDEGRIVSKGSLRKAQNALNATDAEVGQQLKNGVGQGVMVNPYDVADAIGATAEPGQAFARQVNAAPDVAAVRDVQANFLTNPEVGPPAGSAGPLQGLPADVAHDFARNTGKNLKGKFGRLGSATVEAEKAGRADITGQLRAGIPELEPLWAQEAQQITARDAIAQALKRSGNRNPLGLETMVGAVGNPALATMGFLDRSPAFTSMLAQGLYKSAGTGGTALPAALRAAIIARLNAAQQP